MNAESVRNLLEKHVPVDERESAHLRDVMSLLDAGAQAWNRSHYEPGHLTASAFVVDAASRSIALIFHGKLKRWLQPGGHAEDADSDLLEAARRELSEETGMKPGSGKWHLLDVDIHLIPARLDQPEHKHFDIRFALVLQGGARPDITAADDAVDACWMPLDALAKSGEDGMLRCLRKLIRLID